MSTQTTAHTYTIKEASSLTGLPASTLRYYESIGIVDPIERDVSSKQRVYSEEDLGILDAVACLNATGLSLDDMRTYIRNRHRGSEGANTQIQLLTAQKHHLSYEAKLLKVRQQYVDLKIKYWRAVEAGSDTEAQQIGNAARKLADILKHPSAQ